MRTNIFFPLLILFNCAFPCLVQGQTADNKVLTGVSVTFMDYKGLVNKQFFNPKNFNPGVRLNANMYINSWLNYTLAASFVPRASYPQVDGSFNPQLLIDANTGLQLKANNGKILNEEAVVAPYIYSGLGYSTSEGKSGVYLPAAVGVRFRLGNHVNLNIESMYRVKFSSTIQPMSHTIGFNFILPSQKPPVETASRGKTKPTKPTAQKPVITTNPTKPQIEPDTATENVATNVPVDSQATEELVQNQPIVEKDANDQDGDGVEDKYDACPDVAGPVEEGGCPPREKVETADTKVEELVPDADGDGVEDRFDPCPHIWGKKEQGGCPERQVIGKAEEINTGNDTTAVANVPTPITDTVSTENTPPNITGDVPVSPITATEEKADSTTQTPVREEVTQNEEVEKEEEVQQTLSADDMARLKIIAMNMSYKPGTDALMPGTESYIQELKDLLTKYPTYKLVVRGHYSAGREEDDNKVMSVKRAFQIKRQLILTKGMPPVRMNPDGFGSTETAKKNESRIELSLIPMGQ